MKRKKLIWSLIIAICLLCFFLYWFKGKAKEEILIETAVVTRGDVSNIITATGTVKPTVQVLVGTQVSGVLKKIHVDFNSRVKKGDLLAELDKAALLNNVTEARANVSIAQNELTFQQKNVDRVSTLYTSKQISQSDYEQALYQLNNAKANLEKSKSAFERSTTNLNYASIYSPIDGIVLSRSVDVGQTVAASLSAPTLFILAKDLKQMQVEANIDEADIGQVQPGQKVIFTVDAFPDDNFTGKVAQVRLEPIVVSNVVTYNVIVHVDNKEGKLMPGLTANLSIYTQEVKNVLVTQAKVLRFEVDKDLIKIYRKKIKSNDAPENEILEGENSERLKKRDKNNWDKNNWDKNDGKKDWSENDKRLKGKDPNKKKLWIKKGEALIPKKVTLGLNNGTDVQIIDGLEENDSIVYSMTLISKKKMKQSDSPAKSPFMPQRPGRKNTGQSAQGRPSSASSH